jgi:hypothetical protein
MDLLTINSSSTESGMGKSQFPRISFGIIVVNGEPFTRYCLRSIYPFAYEIIVVEGGGEAARAVTTKDGHSIDETLETLYKFKEEEDPENKIQIITRKGHWLQQDEYGRHRTLQSRAYADRATGDYLWQVDIDEFYKPDDMRGIIEILSKDPSITAISFMTQTFWARPEYVIDGWELRRGGAEFHRLFKWGPGYKYITHQPPTVVDDKGRDLRFLNWVRGKQLARKGIYMYHYAFLFPWQVKQKTLIYKYQDPEEYANIVQWAENNYFHLRNPYRVHRPYKWPSWLKRYQGSHPPEVIHMMSDIDQGIIQTEERQIDDVEKVLSSWWYPVGIWGLKVGNYFDFGIWRTRVCLGKVKRWVLKRLFFNHKGKMDKSSGHA